MASEIFAKIGDIRGESAFSQHKDEIEVLSYAWGITRPWSVASNAATGKAAFSDFTFVHKIDKATPRLFEACATNMHFPEATFTHHRANANADYLIIRLTDVFVTGVALSDAQAGGTEIVTLAFAKADLEYKPQKPDGSLDTGVHFKYNIKTGQIA